MRLKLLPSSLLGRSFLLITLLMLAAVAAWLAIFREAELEPRARMLAQTIASVTNLTRTALLTARPEVRIDLLAELSDVEGVHVYPAEDDDRITPPPANALTRLLERELRARLGEKTRLAFELNGEAGLFVSFSLFDDGDNDYWLALPRERLERRLPWPWLGWGAAVLLLALAGAWWIVYRLVRPLEEERALLLAGISHDLRTPLTRLRMEIELSVSDPAAREAMAADIAEMDRTIGQFLDFARPGGAPERARTRCAVPTLLAEIATRYGPPVVCRPANGDFHVCADPDALRRALVNLVENALRHAGTAAPIELSVARQGRSIVIEVADRGPGIAPGEAERLRQPFTRGEAARTNAGGAGLGLAIVERIVRAHGGRLELANRAGGGLVARLILPARD